MRRGPTSFSSVAVLWQAHTPSTEQAGPSNALAEAKKTEDAEMNDPECNEKLHATENEKDIADQAACPEKIDSLAETLELKQQLEPAVTTIGNNVNDQAQAETCSSKPAEAAADQDLSGPQIEQQSEPAVTPIGHKVDDQVETSSSKPAEAALERDLTGPPMEHKSKPAVTPSGNNVDNQPNTSSGSQPAEAALVGNEGKKEKNPEKEDTVKKEKTVKGTGKENKHKDNKDRKEKKDKSEKNKKDSKHKEKRNNGKVEPKANAGKRKPSPAESAAGSIGKPNAEPKCKAKAKATAKAKVEPAPPATAERSKRKRKQTEQDLSLPGPVSLDQKEKAFDCEAVHMTCIVSIANVIIWPDCTAGCVLFFPSEEPNY